MVTLKQIRNLVGSSMVKSGSPINVTFTNYTTGTRSTAQPTAGSTPTPTSYTAKGFVDSYDDRQIDGTRVQAGDRRVLILGSTVIPAGGEPEPGGTIEVDGESLTIVKEGVKADPAKATFTCQSRKA